MLGLAATQQYYTLSEVAGRVLPALCPLLMDTDTDVRQHCFRTVRGFLGKLEKVSEDPSLREEMEADINSQTPTAANSASGWAGWAMGALTTVYKTTQRAKAKPGRCLTGHSWATNMNIELAMCGFAIENGISRLQLYFEQLFTL